LNFYLIPRYGVKGAAFATLISQSVASYLSYVTNKKTLKLFGMMSKSLFLITLFEFITKKAIASRS
jgi:O-antigen/teichoic acid export membrane protein